MAAKIPGFKFFTAADAKTRIFIILAGILGIAFVGYFVFRYFGGSGATTGPSKVAQAPGSLQTVPGAQMSPEFYRAVMQANTQAAQQAQMTGGSAVPTLVNIPGQQPAPVQEGGCIICPSDDNANVADDINNLVKEGKLSQEDANKLLDLAKNNATVDEYAAALNELVRQGKLTPEQARALLDKYKKQHANNLKNEAAQVMDALIKTGALPVDVANNLLALQKSGVSAADYAAELNRLVREGKISPDTAAQLLAQYTQQQMREKAKEGAFALKKMAAAGEITQDVANGLADLQNRNVPVDQYAAELDRLVREGKLTPAAAAKLLEQYRAQRASLGGAGTLNSLLGQEEAKAAGLLNDLLKSGKISKDVADALYDLQRKGVSPEDYNKYIDQLVREGKLSPEDAARLKASYQKLAGMRDQVNRLGNLQANNASVEAYTDELKKAVQAGLITPEMAATLLEQYRALVAPPVGPPIAGTEAAIPGTEGFAAMQARLAGQQPTGIPEGPTFVAPSATVPVPVVAVEDPAIRAQRIANLQAAMGAQAQSLIAAWQPPVMVHRDGSLPAEIEEKAKAAAAQAAEASKTTTLIKKSVLIKAGTVAFGVLDTEANSDFPDTPIMATIIDGPLKGARLLGKLALAQGKDRISLTFSLMNKDEWETSRPVNAFAIDPDTARTVMATSVDYHYLRRFGAIMATSFIQGYAQAITQEGTTNTNIIGTSVTRPALSPTNKLAVGLGQIGTTLGGMVAKNIDIPPTVRVRAGVGIGLLFMSDVTE